MNCNVIFLILLAENQNIQQYILKQFLAPTTYDKQIAQICTNINNTYSEFIIKRVLYD